MVGAVDHGRNRCSGCQCMTACGHFDPPVPCNMIHLGVSLCIAGRGGGGRGMVSFTPKCVLRGIRSEGRRGCSIEAMIDHAIQLPDLVKQQRLLQLGGYRTPLE